MARPKSPREAASRRASDEDNNERNRPYMNPKNVNETRMQKTQNGKGDIRYWQARVRKTRSTRGDYSSENAFYSVSFQHGGRRMGLSLGTPNEVVAATKAKEMYFFLIANGWDALLAKYRAKENAPMDSGALTVGESRERYRSKVLAGCQGNPS